LGQEIELKFLCEPADLDAVLAAAPGEGAQIQRLNATYFDTPDQLLAKARISLRLRDEDGRRVQTLKRGEGFSREEHEAPAPDEGLDLGMPALRKALTGAQRGALEPAFTVQVTRRARTFLHQGAEIELAVDQGIIRAGDRSEPVSEIELELKAGPPQALFEVARELSRTAPLYLSFDGKAYRGQALRDGAEMSPRRHDRIRLKRGADVTRALQTVGRSALSQLAANALVLRAVDGEEPLHQVRVAVRRLRSALTVFKPIADDEVRPALAAELKWLLSACDEARDLDVFAHDNHALGGDAAISTVVESARAGAHARAQAAVTSKRFRDLLLEADAWIETGPWLEAGGRAEARRSAPASEFAVKALGRRWKRVSRRGRELKDLGDADRHHLRIDAKKLRYAFEAFAPLFDAREGERFLKRLKALQDALGALNDAAVATRLVERLAPKGAGAAEASRLLLAREARRGRQMKAAVAAMEALADGRRPWDV